jgi:hypothetical protein
MDREASLVDGRAVIDEGVAPTSGSDGPPHGGDMRAIDLRHEASQDAMFLDVDRKARAADPAGARPDARSRDTGASEW